MGRTIQLQFMILVLGLFVALASSPLALADRLAHSYASDSWDESTDTADGLATTSSEEAPFELMGNSGAYAEKPEIRPNSTPMRRVQPGVGEPKPLPAVPSPAPKRSAEMTPSFRRGCGGYPICDPFYAEFKACEPSCEPIGYHSQRNDPGSCHNNGRAIDVFGMKCSDTGQTYKAINNGRYQEMVKCVKRRGKLRVLWQNGPFRTSGHRDHAHFSVGCRGGRYW